MFWAICVPVHSRRGRPLRAIGSIPAATALLIELRIIGHCELGSALTTGIGSTREQRRWPQRPKSLGLFAFHFSLLVDSSDVSAWCGFGSATPLWWTVRARWGVAPVALAARHRLSDGVPTGGVCILCKSISLPVPELR